MLTIVTHFKNGVSPTFIPTNTRRCFDVNSTSFERYGRQIDVEATLCVYWDVRQMY